MTDPFEEATASNKAAPSSGNVDSVPAGALKDADDPFGTSSEYKGSGRDWDYRLPFDEARGRLVVMLPLEYTDKAEKPEEYRKDKDDVYREEYRVDLWLLNGDPFSYKVMAKKEGSEEKEEKVIEVSPSAGTDVNGVKVPGQRFRRQSIFTPSLIGALKGVDKDGRLLIGVLDMVPWAQDARKGLTPEKLEENRAAWLKGGGKGTAPRYTWGLDDRPHILTPELRSLAKAWWDVYRTTI